MITIWREKEGERECHSAWGVRLQLSPPNCHRMTCYHPVYLILEGKLKMWYVVGSREHFWEILEGTALSHLVGQSQSPLA